MRISTKTKSNEKILVLTISWMEVPFEGPNFMLNDFLNFADFS